MAKKHRYWFSFPVLLVGLAIGLAAAVAVSVAYASLTFNATSVVSDSSLGLTGSGSSTVDIGTGTLSFQTTNNGPIAVGSGFFKFNGLNASALLGTDAGKNATSVAIGSYLGLSGGTLTVSSTLASSSLSFNFYTATTTTGYSFAVAYTANQHTIASVDCGESAAATTTIELGYATTSAKADTGAIGQIILNNANFVCGNAGASTSSFTTSTVPAGTWLIAVVSSTAGSPIHTTFNIGATKQ